MRTIKNQIVFGFCIFIFSACASTEKAKQETAESVSGTSALAAQDRVSQSAFDQVTTDWPKTPRSVAQKMTDKYGLPNEATKSMLIWHNNGPWKRSIVYREEVTHLFPKKHTDVLEQFLDLKVPAEKFDDLAKYDGSVMVERTKGEISARCDKEEMNMLALNLAKEIIDGKKGVDEARKEYAKSAMAFMMGKTNDYTDNLNFRSAKNTADPDQSFMKDMMGKESASDTSLE